MKGLIAGLAIAIALTVLSVPFASTPSFAICNAICQAKCTLHWKQYFASKAECVRVWSRRNGPSGRGCGQPGGQFVSCGD